MSVPLHDALETPAVFKQLSNLHHKDPSRSFYIKAHPTPIHEYFMIPYPRLTEKEIHDLVYSSDRTTSQSHVASDPDFPNQKPHESNLQDDVDIDSFIIQHLLTEVQREIPHTAQDIASVVLEPLTMAVHSHQKPDALPTCYNLFTLLIVNNYPFQFLRFFLILLRKEGLYPHAFVLPLIAAAIISQRSDQFIRLVSELYEEYMITYPSKSPHFRSFHHKRYVPYSSPGSDEQDGVHSHAASSTMSNAMWHPSPILTTLDPNMASSSTNLTNQKGEKAKSTVAMPPRYKFLWSAWGYHSKKHASTYYEWDDSISLGFRGTTPQVPIKDNSNRPNTTINQLVEKHIQKVRTMRFNHSRPQNSIDRRPQTAEQYRAMYHLLYYNNVSVYSDYFMPHTSSIASAYGLPHLDHGYTSRHPTPAHETDATVAKSTQQWLSIGDVYPVPSKYYSDSLQSTLLWSTWYNPTLTYYTAPQIKSLPYHAPNTFSKCSRYFRDAAKDTGDDAFVDVTFPQPESSSSVAIRSVNRLPSPAFHLVNYENSIHLQSISFECDTSSAYFSKWLRRSIPIPLNVSPFENEITHYHLLQSPTYLTFNHIRQQIEEAVMQTSSAMANAITKIKDKIDDEMRLHDQQLNALTRRATKIKERIRSIVRFILQSYYLRNSQGSPSSPTGGAVTHSKIDHGQQLTLGGVGNGNNANRVIPKDDDDDSDVRLHIDECDYRVELRLSSALPLEGAPRSAFDDNPPTYLEPILHLPHPLMQNKTTRRMILTYLDELYLLILRINGRIDDLPIHVARRISKIEPKLAALTSSFPGRQITTENLRKRYQVFNSSGSSLQSEFNYGTPYQFMAYLFIRTSCDRLMYLGFHKLFVEKFQQQMNTIVTVFLTRRHVKDETQIVSANNSTRDDDVGWEALLNVRKKKTQQSQQSSANQKTGFNSNDSSSSSSEFMLSDALFDLQTAMDAFKSQHFSDISPSTALEKHLEAWEIIQCSPHFDIGHLCLTPNLFHGGPARWRQKHDVNDINGLVAFLNMIVFQYFPPFFAMLLIGGPDKSNDLDDILGIGESKIGSSSLINEFIGIEDENDSDDEEDDNDDDDSDSDSSSDQDDDDDDDDGHGDNSDDLDDDADDVEEVDDTSGSTPDESSNLNPQDIESYLKSLKANPLVYTFVERFNGYIYHYIQVCDAPSRSKTQLNHLSFFLQLFHMKIPAEDVSSVLDTMEKELNYRKLAIGDYLTMHEKTSQLWSEYTLYELDHALYRHYMEQQQEYETDLQQRHRHSSDGFDEDGTPTMGLPQQSLGFMTSTDNIVSNTTSYSSNHQSSTGSTQEQSDLSTTLIGPRRTRAFMHDKQNSLLYLPILSCTDNIIIGGIRMSHVDLVSQCEPIAMTPSHLIETIELHLPDSLFAEMIAMYKVDMTLCYDLVYYCDHFKLQEYCHPITKQTIPMIAAMKQWPTNQQLIMLSFVNNYNQQDTYGGTLLLYLLIYATYLSSIEIVLLVISHSDCGRTYDISQLIPTLTLTVSDDFHYTIKDRLSYCEPNTHCMSVLDIFLFYHPRGIPIQTQILGALMLKMRIDQYYTRSSSAVATITDIHRNPPKDPLLIQQDLILRDHKKLVSHGKKLVEMDEEDAKLAAEQTDDHETQVVAAVHPLTPEDGVPPQTDPANATKPSDVDMDIIMPQLPDDDPEFVDIMVPPESPVNKRVDIEATPSPASTPAPAPDAVYAVPQVASPPADTSSQKRTKKSSSKSKKSSESRGSAVPPEVEQYYQHQAGLTAEDEHLCYTDYTNFMTTAIDHNDGGDKAPIRTTGDSSPSTFTSIAGHRLPGSPDGYSRLWSFFTLKYAMMCNLDANILFPVLQHYIESASTLALLSSVSGTSKSTHQSRSRSSKTDSASSPTQYSDSMPSEPSPASTAQPISVSGTKKGKKTSSSSTSSAPKAVDPGLGVYFYFDQYLPKHAKRRAVLDKAIDASVSMLRKLFKSRARRAKRMVRALRLRERVALMNLATNMSKTKKAQMAESTNTVSKPAMQMESTGSTTTTSSSTQCIPKPNTITLVGNQLCLDSFHCLVDLIPKDLSALLTGLAANPRMAYKSPLKRKNSAKKLKITKTYQSHTYRFLTLVNDQNSYDRRLLRYHQRNHENSRYISSCFTPSETATAMTMSGIFPQIPHANHTTVIYYQLFELLHFMLATNYTGETSLETISLRCPTATTSDSPMRAQFASLHTSPSSNTDHNLTSVHIFDRLIQSIPPQLYSLLYGLIINPLLKSDRYIEIVTLCISKYSFLSCDFWWYLTPWDPQDLLASQKAVSELPLSDRLQTAFRDTPLTYQILPYFLQSATTPFHTFHTDATMSTATSHLIRRSAALDTAWRYQKLWEHPLFVVHTEPLFCGIQPSCLVEVPLHPSSTKLDSQLLCPSLLPSLPLAPLNQSLCDILVNPTPKVMVTIIETNKYKDKKKSKSSSSGKSSKEKKKSSKSSKSSSSKQATSHGDQDPGMNNDDATDQQDELLEAQHILEQRYSIATMNMVLFFMSFFTQIQLNMDHYDYGTLFASGIASPGSHILPSTTFNQTRALYYYKVSPCLQYLTQTLSDALARLDDVTQQYTFNRAQLILSTKLLQQDLGCNQAQDIKLSTSLAFIDNQKEKTLYLQQIESSIMHRFLLFSNHCVSWAVSIQQKPTHHEEFISGCFKKTYLELSKQINPSAASAFPPITLTGILQQDKCPSLFPEQQQVLHKYHLSRNKNMVSHSLQTRILSLYFAHPHILPTTEILWLLNPRRQHHQANISPIRHWVELSSPPPSVMPAPGLTPSSSSPPHAMVVPTVEDYLQSIEEPLPLPWMYPRLDPTHLNPMETTSTATRRLHQLLICKQSLDDVIVVHRTGSLLLQHAPATIPAQSLDDMMREVCFSSWHHWHYLFQFNHLSVNSEYETSTTHDMVRQPPFVFNILLDIFCLYARHRSIENLDLQYQEDLRKIKHSKIRIFEGPFTIDDLNFTFIQPTLEYKRIPLQSILPIFTAVLHGCGEYLTYLLVCIISLSTFHQSTCANTAFNPLRDAPVRTAGLYKTAFNEVIPQHALHYVYLFEFCIARLKSVHYWIKSIALRPSTLREELLDIDSKMISPLHTLITTSQELQQLAIVKIVDHQNLLHGSIYSTDRKG